MGRLTPLLRETLIGKVVYSSYTYRSSTRNTFYVIVRETAHSVWLKRMESIRTGRDDTGQWGTEMPAPFEPSSLRGGEEKDLVRAKKYLPSSPGDNLYFASGRGAFFLWDGKPLKYDDRD